MRFDLSFVTANLEEIHSKRKDATVKMNKKENKRSFLGMRGQTLAKPNSSWRPTAWMFAWGEISQLFTFIL